MTNREILFRGFHPCKDGDTTIYVEGKAVVGRWVEGSLLIYADGDSFICCRDIIPDSLRKYEVLPSTVCQDTGLNDKNGRKIFKGDIIRTTIGNNGIIKFGIVPEYLGWNGVSHIAFYVEWDCEDLRPDLPNWINRVEVIGTIFDEPKEVTP